MLRGKGKSETSKRKVICPSEGNIIDNTTGETVGLRRQWAIPCLMKTITKKYYIHQNQVLLIKVK